MNQKQQTTNISVHHKIITLFLLAIMVVMAFIDLPLLGNIDDEIIVSNIIIRFLGGFIVIYWMIILGYGWIFKSHHGWQAFLVMIPGFIISLNNFPISAYFNGRAILTVPVYRVFLFLVECLSVGFFEEIIFRGILLIFLLKTFSKLKMNLILSIVISSFVFALSHLFNLFSGASYGDTFLQIGYSFLVGMMWAVMFLKTKNIWLTMLLHASFNFFGQVMFYLGDVNNRYDLLTISMTILLAILASLYTFKLYKSISYDTWA
jgi:membrane protease YdiL (CAAX protease family)